MVNVPFFTWAFTVRPLNGVTDDEVAGMLKWVKKFPRASFLAQEYKGGPETRHLHGAIHFPSKQFSQNVALTICRIFKHRTQQEHKIMRKGVTLWYNYDWHDQYCDKPDTIFLHDNVPLDIDFPPPQDKSACRPVNPWFDAREKEYLELGYPVPARNEDISKFLNIRMYVDREIQVISDPRMYMMKVNGLRNWINKISTSSLPGGNPVPTGPTGSSRPWLAAICAASKKQKT